MRNGRVLLLGLAIVSFSRVCCGWGQEQIGPDSSRSHLTTAQPDWPAGILEIARDETRVYSSWVNGNEEFYFQATPADINRLIRLFSETRMRDHALSIKPGDVHVKTFDGDLIAYNVRLDVVGGIALQTSQDDERADTYEPTMTVYADPNADPNADQTFWSQITLPANIILNNEVATCPLTSAATKPERTLWYAYVLFDDSTPAMDAEGRLATAVTLWEKEVEDGIKLGRVNHKGEWHAAFSEHEIADLKAGKSWLTLTPGNWSTEAKKDDPRLNLENLARDKNGLQPVRIPKPKFYYGRILFEDGSAPILDPKPWPGAEIRVEFPYAHPGSIDSEGYFSVYFTEEQYETLAAEKGRKNIYIPSYEESGSSTALFVFPVSKLSQDKAEAGVVKIPKPGRKKND